MTDDKQGLREPVTQDRRRRCPTCAAFTRLLCSMPTPPSARRFVSFSARSAASAAGTSKGRWRLSSLLLR